MTFDTPFRIDVPATTVHVRASGADAWSEVSYLYVDSLGYSVGGAFGQAVLRYHYGRIQREDTTSFGEYAKLLLDRYYVRITYTPNTPSSSTRYWFGIIIGARDEPAGEYVNIAAGNQTFTAVTLDWLLTQRQVTDSRVRDGVQTRTVDRAIPFNAAEGNTAVVSATPAANREPTPAGVPVFAEHLPDASLWTAADILEYLVQYHSPTSIAGDGPAWIIETTVSDHLDWFTPVLVTEGRTVYDLINALVDSRRGLSWFVDVYENLGQLTCELYVVGFSSSAIPLTDSKSLPANSPVNLELEDRRQVTRVVKVSDSQQRYTQVRVTGARRGCCFSIGVGDDTMEPDWSSTDEAYYLAGDTTAATKTQSEDRLKHDAFRSSDALRHVFTRFRLPDPFFGMAGNGTDHPHSYICPGVDPYTGELVAGGMPFWPTGIRFQKKLPLLNFRDYRSSIEDPVDNSPAGALPEPLNTFAVANMGGTRMLTHTLQAAQNDETGPAKGTSASCVVEVIPNAPALYVTPSSLPHANAVNDFDPDVDGSDVDTVLEWETLICTVAVEWDAMCEAVYPETAEAAINDHQNPLTIRLGDRARMDYVVPGTVLGVEEGELVSANVGGFVRNDHPLLRDVARLAWLWYSEPRTAVRIEVSHVSDELAIGHLVGTVDGVAANSLVTSVRYDFRRGATTIETQFANIDPRRLVG